MHFNYTLYARENRGKNGHVGQMQERYKKTPN